MVIVKGDAVEGPDEAILTEMGKYNQQLVDAGVMLAGEGLRGSAEGKRVRFTDGTASVIDGPFAESKELIAGYWIWKVDSMDEAIDWVKRMPNPQTGTSEIEIRRVWETEEFGDEMTPELRAQEERMREQMGRAG
jgi:hypothetical protein